MATYSGNGAKKISAKAKKAYIMSVNNWTNEEYRKNYDIFKNKLRFYENVQASRGIAEYKEGGERYKQSPVDVLYRTAKAKKNFGEEYEPSLEMQEIMRMSAHSIKKGERIAQRPSSESYKHAVSAIVDIRFRNFYDYYDKAKEIMEKITDPVKQEEALAAFAAYLHEHYPRTGKDKGAPKARDRNGFAEGETIGSGEPERGSEFEISYWLDD